jgi:hypothetical protein
MSDTVASDLVHVAGETFVVHCRVRDGCMCVCVGVLRLGVWTEVAREVCTVPSQPATLTVLESILHGVCDFAGYLVDRGLVEKAARDVASCVSVSSVACDCVLATCSD